MNKTLPLLLLLFAASFGISHAQTSGPTAPEYTSFEPVDATDMVNLATGDFTYTLPVIEIPGPEGGYPLALSYHAGIQPNEEASWVGLGFTLNAGAITRTVNGYPDDQLAATRVVRDRDSGAERHTFSVGVGLPGVSYNLQVSHDSNLGLGIGSSMGLSLPLLSSPDGSVSAGPTYTVGVSPHGGAYQSVGFGFSVGQAGKDAQGLAANVGVSTNFESVSFSGGVSYQDNQNPSNSHSLLGASIASNGGGASVSAVGVSVSQTNNNAGNWTTNSFGFTIPIPLGNSGLFLNLGYNYLRYYLDETDYVQVFGVLNARGADGKDLGKFSFDSYALLDTDTDYIENNDPDREVGGSFPAYDSYAVNAQGLSGNIQPYLFQNMSLFRQNVAGVVDFNPRRSYNGEVGFRFVNDFSNSLTLKDDWRYNTTDQRFENTQNVTDSDYGFADNRLAGSKHVEWYTNLEIRNGVAHNDGLISHDYFGNHSIVFDSLDVGDQIGGFKITKADGTTYHFALPVYNYEDYFRAQNEEKPDDLYHERREGQPYSYQWLLTAITGSDFVDRGEPGLDGKDWGYWVGFRYEQYVKNHRWRNPTRGYHRDIDSKTQLYSSGMKELYYLDAIFTRTHVAMFHKSDRLDAREVADLTEGGFAGTITDYQNYPSARKKCWIYSYFPFGNTYENCMADNLIPDTTYYPRPFRRLDKITLHRVEDLITDGYSSEKSLRAVKFDYDYSLQREMPNSFAEENLSVKEGKLTLNQVRFLGKQEQQIVPPVSFGYDLDEPSLAVKFYADTTLEDVHSKLSPGDLITFNQNETAYYAVVLNEQGGRYAYNFIGQASRDFPGGPGTSITVSKTKNPPYRKEAYDSWGMYKSDFDSAIMDIDQNLARFTTIYSAKSTDAWSLRRINSSLGSSINIAYESDDYAQPILYKKRLFNAIDIQYYPNTQEIAARFPEVIESFDSYFELNQTIDLDVIIGFPKWRSFTFSPFECGDEDSEQTGNKYYVTRTISGEIVRFDNQTKEIYIRSATLFSALNEEAVQGETESTSSFCPTGHDNSCGNQCCTDECDSENNDCTTPQSCNKTITTYYEGDGEIAALSLSSSANSPSYGGGIRVASVQVSTQGGHSATVYRYMDSENKTIGITSFDPTNVNAAYFISDDVIEQVKIDYRKLINKNFSHLLAISREVPAPGVIYGQVTVSEEVDGRAVPGKMVYEFETFDSTMVERLSASMVSEDRGYPCNLPKCSDIAANCGNELESSSYCEMSCGEALTLCKDEGPTQVYVRDDERLKYPVTIRDYSVRVGNLKAVTTYGKDDVRLARTDYGYLHDYYAQNDTFRSVLAERFSNQGVVAEGFNEFKTVTEKDGAVRDKVSLSKKESYPNVMVGQRTTDYRTGAVNESWNLAFDRFSGAVTHTLNKDSYGQHVLNQTVPAYTVEDYRAKMDIAQKGGKNMLTQQAASYSYLVEAPPDSLPFLAAAPTRTGLLAASVQTWSTTLPVRTDSGAVIQQASIPRQQASYAWDGQAGLQTDGSYPLSDFQSQAFNYANPPSNSQWEKTGEITRVDVFSHALEARDLNGERAATRMSMRNDLPVATAAPARYDEFTFSGAEYYEGNDRLDNGVDRQGGVPSSARAHSGEASLLVASGYEGFSYTLKASDSADLSQPYRASVWVYMPGTAEAQEEMDYVELYAEADGAVIATASPVFQQQKSKSWYLLQLDVVPPARTKELRIACKNEAIRAIYLDDFRVHPQAAAMQSYLYDPFTREVTYILDADNLYTHYEYNDAGRLVRTTREFFHPVDRTLSESIVNYGVNHQ